jgi:uncharacterized protein (TIGR02271 family)
MPPAPAKVIGPDGLSGTVEPRPGTAAAAGGKGSPDAAAATACPPGTDTSARANAIERLTVRLDDGRRLLVPADALTAQADGSYYLALRAADLPEADAATGAGEVVVPLLAEQLRVGARPVETGRVRITKLVREEQEVIDRPLLQEQVDVERVTMNRFVDGPVPTRTEGPDGQTLVIPLLEEVLVVEKRLMLREEVRVTRRSGVHHDPRTVTVRTEEARVERVPGADARGAGADKE